MTSPIALCQNIVRLASTVVGAVTLALAACAAAGETIYLSRTPSGQPFYSSVAPSADAEVLMRLGPASSHDSAWVLGRKAPAAVQMDVAPVPAFLRRRTRGPVPDEATLSLVHQAARRHALDVDMLLALIRQESGFNPHAVSHAGARGLIS